ncbi:hypothetical protein LH51_17580 [Nitrincola sp. A-D6]|uniref:hypothetical protein n=1 Tax=Nitrincola sp. A-D6 TaxID=1545442 RepID=UPI00051FEC81|nr:hypothetical protein [Nitrincola sp. A-D6]KGK41043.1 hypothetical protein LH51_17580 [Nitrincola sp. A-D6]
MKIYIVEQYGVLNMCYEVITDTFVYSSKEEAYAKHNIVTEAELSKELGKWDTFPCLLSEAEVRE